MSNPAFGRLRLGVNIDHIATIRNARLRSTSAHPALLRGVDEAAAGGADLITFHLREDRRHILDEDVYAIKAHSRLPLNFEMAATAEMTAIALALKPQAVCLVPERRMEVTTEGGLDVRAGAQGLLGDCILQLQKSGIQVALFIDPDPEQVDAAAQTSAAAIELHTGRYCNFAGAEQKREYRRLREAAAQAKAAGLEVHAGHGLNYNNVAAIATIPEVVELNIGHYIIGEAIFTGLCGAVSRMRAAIDQARR